MSILTYLHSLDPPVIHRDIKPQNIIYQSDTGKLFLVDFGAVQDTYHHTVMGSTVVGTYGYMAPEQFRGGAVLATDLYSLGCTLLFLLIGRSPAELPQENLKINFRNSIEIEPNFARWIDKLIAPDIGDRFPTAQDALLCLRDRDLIGNYQNTKPKKPEYSSIKLTYYQRKLIINLPPVIKYKIKPLSFYILLLWNAFLIVNTLIISICFVSFWGIGGIFAVLLLGCMLDIMKTAKIFYIFQLFVYILLVRISFSYLSVNAALTFSFAVIFIQYLVNFELNRKLMRENIYQTKIECSKNKIIIKRKSGEVWYVDALFNKGKAWDIERYAFGYYLTLAEKRWLSVEISKYLGESIAFTAISGDRAESFFDGGTIERFFTIFFKPLTAFLFKI